MPFNILPVLEMIFDAGDKYTDRIEMTKKHSLHRLSILYTDPLKSLAEIIKQTGPGGYDEGKKINLRNAARILRAFLFARLTDYYGSVPYFEALQATNIHPFSSLNTISKKISISIYLKELDEASAELNAYYPDEGFCAADIIYNGDVAKWKRWGYSLMLRAAMKVSNVDASLANTYVAKAVAGGSVHIQRRQRMGSYGHRPGSVGKPKWNFPCILPRGRNPTSYLK